MKIEVQQINDGENRDKVIPTNKTAAIEVAHEDTISSIPDSTANSIQQIEPETEIDESLTENSPEINSETFDFEAQDLAIDLNLPKDSYKSVSTASYISKVLLIGCGITLLVIGCQNLWGEYTSQSWNRLITLFSAIICVIGALVTLSIFLSLFKKRRSAN